MPPRTPPRPWLLAAALVAGLGGCAAEPAAPGAACRPERVVEQGARLVDDQLVVPVELDGQSAEFLVDTGSARSLITPEAAQRLGLRRDPRQSTLILGAGGGAVSADAAARRYGVGSRVALDIRGIAVGPLPLRGTAHVDGLLGADVFAGFEVDLDVPQSRLGLWRAEGCGADFDPLEGPHFALSALRAANGLVLVPVRLDGADMLALLDSGAGLTVVTAAAASHVGVGAAALAQDPGSTVLGVDQHRVAFHRHRFAEFVIGPERFPGVTMAVGAVQVSGPGMLLGADYLAHHHVWISRVVPRVFVAPAR